MPDVPVMTKEQLIEKWRKEAFRCREKVVEYRNRDNKRVADCYLEKAVAYETCAKELEALNND